MMKRSLLFLAFVGMVLFATQTSQAATLVVDDDGLASVSNCNATAPAYPNINSAVAAASPGDRIKVCPGTYPENVTIPKPLRLRGAQAGNSYSGRTFAGPNESTLAGLFTVAAPNVTIDGFSVTNPAQGLGILVKTAGNDALIVNNIIDTIGGSTFPDNTVGVYLEHGPDRVRVVANLIRNVVGVRSAQGILIGDSTSADPSLNILIIQNRIENLTSGARGAYGIQVNNGSSSAPTATGYTTVTILCNTVDRLTGGGWAHGIGLEGDTPGAFVQGNSISKLVDLTPDPTFGQNAIAVFFEANPSFPTVRVKRNNFDLTIAEFGIAVHPALSIIPGDVNGIRNWWGNSSGPGPVGPGTGARVSPKVRYAPWLKSRARVCEGRDDDGDSDDGDSDDGDSDDGDSE